MKQKLFFILLTFSLVSFKNSDSPPIEKYANKTIAWTMPKCGTNLLVVILDRIFDNQLEGLAPGIEGKDPSLDKFYMSHFYSFDNFLNSAMYLEKVHNQEKVILLIRDLRDRICSTVDYMNTVGILMWPGILRSTENELTALHLKKYGTQENFEASNYKNFKESQIEVLNEYWNSLTKEDKINKTIYALACLSDKDLNFLNSLKEEISTKHLYLVKYENILPTKGGNNFFNLHREIYRIAKFLEVKMTLNKLRSATKGLWHNSKSWTFTNLKKKKGRWETEFTESNKQLFDEKLGQLNKALGYK